MARTDTLIVLVCLLVASFIAPAEYGDSKSLDIEGQMKANSNSGQNQSAQIQGIAFLNISGPIMHSSSLNATWFAKVLISEGYGTDLLENRSLGLLYQIDSQLGNSDGWVDSEESENFSELVESARNWTDGAAGGCCSFDYVPLYALDGNSVIVQPPEAGPVNRTNGTWGWTESANLSGTTDGRTMRIIDLPRVGALIEEVPLRISLPEDWEISFSPMIEIISGEPRNFTINRSQAPVAYDMRITVRENLPPSVSASRFPASTSTIALDKTSSFSAVCNDSPLDAPHIQWSVSKDESVLANFDNPWFEFVPSEHGFSHGEVTVIMATCTDSHGTTSHWQDNVVVDGLAPSWTGEITIIHDTEEIPQDFTETVIEAHAGSELVFKVNGTDQMGLPVVVELFTNISEGWRQYGTNQKSFSFTVNQGTGVNGAHISVEERHQPKEPTMLSMLLQLSDDAGNLASQEWEIRVLDANSPTILMDLVANGINLELDDRVHENDQVQLSFSRSFDDLDAIEDLVWSVSLDEISLVSNVGWSSVELLETGQLLQGDHEAMVTATDSSGNTRIESFVFTILPKSGAHLVVLEKSLSGGTEIGTLASVSVLVENQGTDHAFARICMEGNCSRYEEFPGATLDAGKASSTIDYEFVISNLTIENLWLQWDSATAGTNGAISIEFVIESENRAASGLIVVALALIAVLATAVFYARRNTSLEP